ncbi:glycosyltransferase family 4 protein [Sporolactobacillus sp. CQH2019]|uniref:glycosyltransferase family 4 protein n=1 Tax=Sporolactobacillus sp. CQH2019 TaxID=3023512 RepID=UPI00236832D0|nr:glycosyltransferase family 4 protein [Sporolactobacillus sp. CQH2019]MDD9148838.1 glycosyltransferase family 4 protein [Sporolactobacillus sp. CQH2019]
MKKSISVVSIGDPLNSKTWSGTPYNICTVLKKRGCFNEAIDSSKISNFRRVLAYVYSMLLYGLTDIKRGAVFRKYYSKRIFIEAHNDINNILHMGTLDMPVFSKDQNHHYLYSDSTWHLWGNQVSNRNSYSEKLKTDAEHLEKLSYENCKHIFSISEYMKQDLIVHYELSPDKITVVGTGTGNIKPFIEEKDYSTKTLLFVAKNRFEDKGGLIVKDAIKLVQMRDPSIKLIIVGDDNYKSYFVDTPNVTIYGYVEWDFLQNLFNKSSIFIMPALNEPWGLVYLEALKCKMPIIGLNKNSLPEITQNGKYGFLINDADPKLLADTIIDAFSDIERLKRMGREGQKYCLNKYTWENVVDKIINEIEIEG